MADPDFYTTRVTIEVEVAHQGDAEQGVAIITRALTGLNFPAVQSVKVLKAETNYLLHQLPATEMHPVKIKHDFIDNAALCEKHMPGC